MIGTQGAALGWIMVAFQAGINIGQPRGDCPYDAGMCENQGSHSGLPLR